MGTPCVTQPCHACDDNENVNPLACSDIVDVMVTTGQLSSSDLCALTLCSKACAIALRPVLESINRERLQSAFKWWKGATPSFVEGAYYWLDHDFHDPSEYCDYTCEVLKPMLEGFGASFDGYTWLEEPHTHRFEMAQCDTLVKCTKVTPDECTFEFSRLRVGHIVVPTHSIKWLCLAEVPACDWVVVPYDSDNDDEDDTCENSDDEDGGDTGDSPHWDVPGKRWVADQDGPGHGYDPDRPLPHAAALAALQAREATMTCGELTKAIAKLRGPVYRPPLTKADAPTYCTMRRKMLVPAFRELRKFGVQCAHDKLMPSPSTIQKALWERYGVDPDDKDEGAYVGYGDMHNGPIPFCPSNNVPFESIVLYHNLGDYKRCRVRAVLERAGFVVTWDDSDTKTIELSLREADAPYELSDNGYASDDSEYDSYSEHEGEGESEGESDESEGEDSEGEDSDGEESEGEDSEGEESEGEDSEGGESEDGV